EVVVAGRHAASGDFGKIRRLMTDRPHRYLVRSSDDRQLASVLIAHASTAGIELDWSEKALRIQAVDFAAFTEFLPRIARDHGIRLFTVSPSDESLESVFSYLVTA
ncbi:MAG: ABC transporter ATP-binding protein, partial [Actinomycetia bacterium]|nr:ABC transporter ATP-binding protein [Actinomycetes bacterium]